MSRKAVIIFSIWTSFFSALFYHFYGMLPDLYMNSAIHTTLVNAIPSLSLLPNFSVDFTACGWIMFVCLAIYFGMGLTPINLFSAMLSAFCGLIWGQVDFLLTNTFVMLGLPDDAAMFVAIVVGTAITMYIHIHLLKNTPFRLMPFVFAGVCLTFSQGGGNEAGLVSTFVIGIVLCAICTFMMGFASKHWPADDSASASSGKGGKRVKKG